MTFQTAAWLFATAFALHNLEEAIFLPKWSRTAGWWSITVDPFAFRFAVSIISIVALFVAAHADMALGVYILCGFAGTMIFNTFIPHLAATLVMRRYAPGAATGFLLVLPTATLLLREAFAQHRIKLDVFLWVGPLVALALLASVPVLFRTGRRLRAATRRL